MQGNELARVKGGEQHSQPACCWSGLPVLQHDLCNVHSSLCCYLQDQEKGHLQQLQSLMPTYRARPSLLGPLAAAAGFSLGAAAGVLPTKFAHAITGDCHELVLAVTHVHQQQG